MITHAVEKAISRRGLERRIKKVLVSSVVLYEILKKALDGKVPSPGWDGDEVVVPDEPTPGDLRVIHVSNIDFDDLFIEVIVWSSTFEKILPSDEIPVWVRSFTRKRLE
jgi:hypothetical protein